MEWKLWGCVVLVSVTLITLAGLREVSPRFALLGLGVAVIALTLMVFATRRGHRTLWMIGGGLMAVVVVKLFVIDLSNLRGLERIVSFIVVGLLMLVIGYFSPVPPRKKEEPAKVEESA